MAVQARGGLSRDEVVFIETTGRGSLDYYAQKLAAELPVAVRDEIRDYAKARLIALGWPAKQAA